MSDKKISELTALTAPDGAEELVVNDSGTSKKITQTNLLSTALPLAGGTMTGTVAGFTSTGIDDNATSTAITIDASENVGIGVTPESDDTSGGGSSLYVAGNGILWGEGSTPAAGNSIRLGNNYRNASGLHKYRVTDEASSYEQYDGTHEFRVAPSGTADTAITWTTAMTIDNSGYIYVPTWYSLTTASAANVYVGSSGDLKRSTSSIKYKKDVETMEDSYADAILNLRPVWFRSKIDSENPDHGFWGLIAEEVAEIDPRLVFWQTEEHTDVLNKETGETEKVSTPLEEPEAEGVQYDRIIPHLINLLKRQDTTIKSLKSLEARLIALENA